MCNHFSTNVDTSFQEFLQLLPKDMNELAYEFKAFARARKIKTPLQLIRLVFMYCAQDLSLRGTAGHFTLLYEKMTDTNVQKRLEAATPWVKALLKKMFSSKQYERFENGGRLLVTDGTVITGPAAKGVDSRIHIVMDLFRLEFVCFDVTDNKGSESLMRVPIQRNDLVLADRGFCRQTSILYVVESGGDVLVRMMLQVVLLDPITKEKFSLVERLREQGNKKYVTIPALFSGLKSEKTIKGWIQAQRLPRKIAEKKYEKCELTGERREKGNQKRIHYIWQDGWLFLQRYHRKK